MAHDKEGNWNQREKKSWKKDRECHQEEEASKIFGEGRVQREKRRNREDQNEGGRRRENKEKKGVGTGEQSCLEGRGTRSHLCVKRNKKNNFQNIMKEEYNKKNKN